MQTKLAAAITAALIGGVVITLSPGQGTLPGKLQIPPGGLKTPGKIPLGPIVAPLFGWADLHAHPASHLAFGAQNSGGTDLFSGLPGMRREDNTLMTDLANCSGDHFWDDADIVRSSLRSAVRNGLEGGYPHGRSGAPTFADWPHARMPIHQQMHVQWVYRAYQGGQRLMVASITDSQTLAMIWNRHQFATRPAFDANFDFESAKRQIAFIERWVGANSGWMQIVTTPEEARTAIRANKMAIILGLEMDRLSTDQILTLIRDFKVRQVIPIHLANNQFGGTAAYKELFNTNNHYLNGAFIQVAADPTLRFKFKRPQFLRYADHTEVGDFVSGLFAVLTLGTIGVGAMVPTPVDDAAFAALRYTTTTPGQRNALAPNENEMKRLFRTGVIVDLAHMSQSAQEGALRISDAANYPVMNSHTGVRGAVGENERAMRNADAARMAARGGVLGIGTTGDHDVATICNEEAPDKQKYFVRLTGSSREWTRPRLSPLVTSSADSYRYLRATVSTAGDDKRDSEGAWVVLILRDGTRMEFPIDYDLKGLGGGSVVTRTHRLTRPLLVSDIARVGVRHHTGSYFKDGLFRTDDNWDVAGLHVGLLPDPVMAWTREAAKVMDTMGGKIALGTDFNGLENLLAGQPNIQIVYPVNIVQDFAPGMKIQGGAATPNLAAHFLPGRPMNFRDVGLAEYGLLPDFLQSVRSYPRGPEVVRSLFRGAENVIVLWEKAIAAKGNVR